VKRLLKRALFALAVAAGLAGGWSGYLRLTGNFHAVEEGVIYRSAQLSGNALSSRIREHGLRSVINLRGTNPGKAWYDEEIKASSTAGVQHVDFGLSSARELTDEQIEKLTALLRDAPRPLLIHCEAGADRSGLASALYKLLVAKRPAEEATGQLSFRYGHFPWLGNSTAAMDRTLDRVLEKLRLAQAGR
jgi:protein tyrosine/serine phosphatase